MQRDDIVIDRESIVAQIRESARLVGTLLDQVVRIAEIGRVVVNALKEGGKVLTAGNGGSAAEAMHMAEELVGRFRSNRVSLPAVSLVADSTALTCISNDFGYDQVFSRQVEGLASAGDVLVLFSSSGKGASLARALEAASGRGVTTVCLLGRDGGPLAGRADYELIVPGQATERIQEVHQVLLHLVLDAVEANFVVGLPQSARGSGQPRKEPI